MIVEATHRVAAGEPMLSPSVTAQLIRRVVSAPAAGSDAGRARAAAARLATLSEREREVAVAVGRGRSDAEIAGELSMSLATVKAHVSHILVETEVASRVQIAICVHEAGLAWRRERGRGLAAPGRRVRALRTRCSDCRTSCSPVTGGAGRPTGRLRWSRAARGERPGCSDRGRTEGDTVLRRVRRRPRCAL